MNCTTTGAIDEIQILSTFVTSDALINAKSHRLQLKLRTEINNFTTTSRATQENLFIVEKKSSSFVINDIFHLAPIARRALNSNADFREFSIDFGWFGRREYDPDAKTFRTIDTLTPASFLTDENRWVFKIMSIPFYFTLGHIWNSMLGFSKKKSNFLSSLGTELSRLKSYRIDKFGVGKCEAKREGCALFTTVFYLIRR